MKTNKETFPSFVFYRSFYTSISLMPENAQLSLFRAIIEYGLDNVSPSFDNAENGRFLMAIWEGIRPQLDKNHERYSNGCKGGEFGKMGGAPKGNQNARKKQPQNNPKTTPNDNVNVNVNVNEELKMPFASKIFVDTWNDLRKQPKWKKKTTTALQKNLQQLAKYPEEFAIELMNRAIAGGYQGVTFASTPKDFQTWKGVQTSSSSSNAPVITNFKEIMQ